MLDPHTLNLAAIRQSSVYDGEVTADVGGQRIAQVENGNAYAELWDNGDSRMLVIRGSDDPIDWWQNIRHCCPEVLLENFGDDVLNLQKVHAGALTHARLIRCQLELEGITELTDKPLWFVGHSIGGAVAQLLPLLDPIWSKAKVICFGSPAVFYDRAPQSTSTGYYHIRNEFDFVPDFPLQFGKWMFARWRHPHFAQVRWFTDRLKQLQPGPLHGVVRRLQRGFDLWQHKAQLKEVVERYHDHRRYAQMFALEVVA